MTVLKADIAPIGEPICSSKKLLNTVRKHVSKSQRELFEDRRISFTGDEIAVLLPDPERFAIDSVRVTGSEGIAAVVSTSRLHNIAGRYTGRDHPLTPVRVQKDFPATGEMLAPYACGHYVAGCMRGTHNMPLLPRGRIPQSVTSTAIAGCRGVLGNEAEKPVSLPSPEMKGRVSVEEAIKRRRSVRSFGRGGLALREVAQLLWSAQGATHRDGLRAAPSAGALYPLELYLVAGEVEELTAGVYRYRPRSHDLVRVASGDLRKPLAAAALDQSYVRRAPAALVFASVYKRVTGKYGRRGRQYAHIEVGHAAENVYLQATALDRRTVFVGAFEDSAVKKALGLPRDHEPLGIMPVGRRR